MNSAARFPTLFLAALVALATTVSLSAQRATATPGTIVGRVTDAVSRFAYDGVRVTVTVDLAG